MKFFSIKPCIIFSLFIFFGIIKSDNFAQSDSLTYIMHSFVKIKTMSGVIIYIDPALVSSYQDSADIVLITHEHSDHNDLTRIKRKSTCITIRAADALKNGVYQTFNISGITIKAVPAYNGYHGKSSCVGYVLQFGNIKLYHAGDTGKIDEMAALASENITYALLPMDGTYTMTPEEATEAAVMINAKHDMPIHTLGGFSGYGQAMVDRFTSPNKLVVKPGSTIALTNTSTSVNEQGSVPNWFNLFQNYPNPFNPQTIIRFNLSMAAKVWLRVFDLLGKEVGELINAQMNAGENKVIFDGSGLSSGVYYYQLTVLGEKESYIKTMKMILQK